MKRGEQKLNIAGVKFGIILIMTAICLAGCTKEEAFVDSCDSEIAEQVTSIMQESQKGRYNLENCEVLVTEESKEAGFLIRRMTFQADWKQIREPEDDPLIQGMLQARDELKSPGEKEAAGRIIDGYIVEMNGEPETEKNRNKIRCTNFSGKRNMGTVLSVCTGGKGNAASTPGICGRKLV